MIFLCNFFLKRIFYSLSAPKGKDGDKDQIDREGDVGSRGATKKVTRHRQMELFINVVNAQLVFEV